MTNVTAFQCACMKVIAMSPNERTSAKSIAVRLGMGPTGRLAVTNAMRSLTQFGFVSAFERGGGIPFYSTETWMITEDGVKWLSEQASA